jgi:NADH dehydrogenase
MTTTAPKLVTVFGGSGFVGKYVVRELVKAGCRVRIPMRRPHLGLDLKVMGNVGQVQLMQANLRFPNSVRQAVAGSDAVINLVAILYEAGPQTFDSLHVDGARNLAEACAAEGITNVSHISAIGADADGESDYARTKGEAEAIIRELIPTADIHRPSIIFGPEDQFFNRFAGMAQLAPALPLIGGGKTQFQPVYVGDVASAIAKTILGGTTGTTYELGGPRTYTFKALMEFMLETIDRKRILAPLPFGMASLMGAVSGGLGKLPFVPTLLTADQVTLLKSDNVATGEHPGLSDLGITPETVEAIVPDYMVRYRKYGQFHRRAEDDLVPAEDI